MSDFPEPLTPPDCNLRGLPFMPLEVQRLLDSDLFILSTGDQFKAAVALWCKSWGQLPGGSLPDNDLLLEGLSGSKCWKKVREVALRGWIKCSDGRLYHPVVAENAIKAWESREDHRETNEGKNERQKRWRERIKLLSAQLRDAGVTPPMNASLAELERLISVHVDKHVDANVDDKASTETSTVDNSETANKSKGQGKGKGTKKGAKAPMPADKLPPWMESLVAIYHEVLPELPGVRVMDKDRDQALRDFWDWVLTTCRPDGKRRATNEAEALEWTRDYMLRARNNDFIMGRGPKSPGHENWRASIEYLLSSRGMKKVLEETTDSQ